MDLDECLVGERRLQIGIEEPGNVFLTVSVTRD
jgi:hypothetical protein